MNLAFPVGFVIALVFMLFGIAFDALTGGFAWGNIAGFVNVTGLLVTIGGTMGTLFSTFPARQFRMIPKHVPIVLGLRKHDPLFYIQTMTNLSQEAREVGLLSLEDSVARIDDAFLRSSVMLVVDSVEPAQVRERLDSEVMSVEERHARTWAFYDKGAALAPGFGLTGTLIGIINMLRAMHFEEEGGAFALAHGMSVALVSTFYGIIMANGIFMPFATQLRAAHSHEMLCKEIIIEGVISIQSGENPRSVNEKLLNLLDSEQREEARQNAGSTAEE